MKLVRLSLAVLFAAAITAGCTASPTATSREAKPSTLPSFDGGGYMGNGGRADTPPRDSSATDDGGGYMGNGG